MQYWPHRRARRRLPRVRTSPDIKEAVLCNMVAFKAGMTHLSMIDDSESPSKNLEVSRAVTVLEVPHMEVYGLRFYGVDPITSYKITKTDVYNKALAAKLNLAKVKHDESKIESMKQRLKEFSDVSVLIAAYPKGLSGVGQHHPVRFESAIGGKSIEEKFDAAHKILGKEIKTHELFKPGEVVDISAITTGKGWQGPIKRFHVKRNAHRATNKVRHGGPLGAYSPGKVFFTVPRAGQLGFNYRTEHNKRILKIGAKTDAHTINVKGGFKNYGVVKNDFIIISGSVGGPAQRMVRLRKSVRESNAKGVKEPKINYVAHVTSPIAQTVMVEATKKK